MKSFLEEKILLEVGIFRYFFFFTFYIQFILFAGK